MIKTLDEYQRAANATSQFKNFGINLPQLVYMTLGLTEEAGETAGIIKKLYRDKEGKLDVETVEHIKHELGDVMWYISQICDALGFTIEDVAEANIEKVRRRLEKNQIRGDGDNR